MASVVFSSLGQAFGGPFGALAGGVAGAGLDSLLFAPRGRSMVDQIQRSAYGVTFPRIYGRARVAGVVIWAHISDQGAKGSGQRSGTASIAVALSAKPILRVGRIWADGREIRNQDGVFVSQTVFRVYDGTQTEPDPVIAATEGAGFAPGHTGLAYVVFENMALEAYGNRIPNLSFEVEADTGDIHAWLKDLSGWEVKADLARTMRWSTGGYAVSVGSNRDDVKALALLAEMEVSDAGGVWQFSANPNRHNIANEDLCSDEAMQMPSGQERMMTMSRLPAGLSIGYLDTSREYQEGMQGATRHRGGALVQMTLPAVLSASDAQAFAQSMLERAELENERLRLVLGWKWLKIAIGDVLTVTGEPGEWRVVERSVRGLLVHVAAVRHFSKPLLPVQAEAGRSMASQSMVIPQTDLKVFELPFALDGGEHGILVSANGGLGWRGAEIGQMSDWSMTPIGQVKTRQPTGRLGCALEKGAKLIWNEPGELLVELADASLVLESRPAQALFAGANLLRIDEELLQFRSAAEIAPGLFRLSGLLRGCYGTRNTTHEQGAAWALIDSSGLVTLPVKEDLVGRKLRVVAQGRGDPPGGMVVEHVVEGRAMQQMAPAHLQVQRTTDGRIVSSWIAVAGSMAGWGSEETPWRGGVWHFNTDGGFTHSVRVQEARLTLSAEEQLEAFGALFPKGRVRVVVDGDMPQPLRTSKTVDI